MIPPAGKEKIIRNPSPVIKPDSRLKLPGEKSKLNHRKVLLQLLKQQVEVMVPDKLL